MITRLITCVFLLLLGAEAWAAAERVPFEVAYLWRDGDPAYAQRRAYTGLRLRDRQRPLPGAQLAIKESKVLGRALGYRFGLREEELSGETDALTRVEALINDGIGVFLLDLPIDEVAALGRALAGRDVILFNFRHRDDSLRGGDCSPVLFHSVPSQAMLMDAMAQFLLSKNWREVLLLVGERDEDKRLGDAFQGSARKFGLEIAAVRDFVLSNDPRQRDRNNLALLTGDADYDVVFLADSLGEVGRYLPYNTKDPRPVVGSEGLVPAAWHWTWERYGAPQLNQRFGKRAKRSMGSEDWAAWAAVKLVIEAISRSETTAIPALRDYLRGDALTFDNYKGVPGSFRSWNNQLRQAILLHSHNAVIARAPFEGFLHRGNSLDSLGADAPETRCVMP